MVATAKMNRAQEVARPGKTEKVVFMKGPIRFLNFFFGVPSSYFRTQRPKSGRSPPLFNVRRHGQRRGGGGRRRIEFVMRPHATNVVYNVLHDHSCVHASQRGTPAI